MLIRWWRAASFWKWLSRGRDLSGAWDIRVGRGHTLHNKLRNSKAGVVSDDGNRKDVRRFSSTSIAPTSVLGCHIHTNNFDLLRFYWSLRCWRQRICVRDGMITASLSPTLTEIGHPLYYAKTYVDLFTDVKVTNNSPGGFFHLYLYLSHAFSDNITPPQLLFVSTQCFVFVISIYFVWYVSVSHT